MTEAHLRVLVTVLVLVALGGLVAAVRAPEDRSVISVSPTERRVEEGDSGSGRWRAALERTNPFRTDHRMTSLRYDPDRPPPPAPPPPPVELPPPVRPPWRLTGILAGPDPVAVFSALPTPDSTRLLQVGDSVGGVEVRWIGSDSVRVAERDSTWVFRLGTPWAPEGDGP